MPMAPPLLPSTRLLTCSACAEHVKTHETTCPHCGADMPGPRLSGAAAMLMGIALTACPGKGGDSDTAGMTMSGGTGDTTASGGGDTDTDAVTTGNTGGGTTNLPEPEYGVPVTTTTAEPDYGVPSTDPSTGGTTVDTDDTDSGGTLGEPEYGVPETTTAEPDYGVPQTSTTAEPDYGVPQTTGG